ncbi:hypothetical protein SAV14893_098690 [Streptomyces avermitilis]|uniref:Uncharacterized protein n=1 Tax=Streptomyces avermitilis TaxID=33903 RepID=A0A4D4N881_STRAX|nr:hypothetical protein SAVMC3_90790 [Streptomyces avermitilis]GDY70476.1 hypothetical protein SAV14893_098690 [Streptomyces avermitilis]GDY80791.1 hypothetical protein SAV31267_102760 [Streptomyces avermitilis]
MGSCGHLATRLDKYMLRDAISHEEDLRKIPPLDPEILRGRLLVTYLFPGEERDFRKGMEGEVYATITPYSPEDAARLLQLPQPKKLRKYVALIDPQEVPVIRGPRLHEAGGIEFLLSEGVPARAVQHQSEWEVQ